MNRSKETVKNLRVSCEKHSHMGVAFAQEVGEWIKYFSGKTITYAQIDAYRVRMGRCPYTKQERVGLVSFLQNIPQITVTYHQMKDGEVRTLIQIAKRWGYLLG